MRLLLSILVAMLMVQSANAQSLWRNFFTTNQNPIVEVVAGSNATVQVSTVGVSLRRFTVNSTATGSGSGQTNWPLSSITNANYLTNWATISTNLPAFLANNQVFTGSNYFTTPLTLSLATNLPAAGQVLTATSPSSAAWQAPEGGSIPSVFGLGYFATEMGGSNGFATEEAILFSENFRGAAVDTRLTLSSALSGTYTFVQSAVGFDGILRLSAYPTNTGAYSSLRNGAVTGWRSKFACDVNFALVGIEQMEYSIGLNSSTVATATTDNIMWLANTNLSANWIASCMANSSATYWTSSVPVASSQVIRLSIYAPSTNAASFYTNGVLATTITNSLHGGRNSAFTAKCVAASASGSVAIQHIYMDWLAFVTK